MLDRFILFALLAAKQAVQGSFGALTGRGGVFVGADMGGTHTMDDGYRAPHGENPDPSDPAPSGWACR